MLNKKNTLLFIFIWTIILIIFRVLQYFSFGTNTFDLAIFDYAFYNTLHGKLFFEPFHGIFASHFGVHFTPTLLLLLPIYFIFPFPLTLMMIQILAVSFSAYFLFKITLKFTDEKVGFIIIIIYLFFRQLLSGIMYDFHPIAFFPLLFFFLFYEMITRKRWLIIVIILILIFGLKEDLALYMILFGVIVFFKIDKKIGLIIFLLSMIYFPLVYFVIQPAFYIKNGNYLFSHWAHLGNSFSNVIINLIKNPFILFKLPWFKKSFLKFLNYIVPLLFLPLFSMYIIPLAVPLLVLITSNNNEMHKLSLHFSFYLLPFIFIALISVIKVLKVGIKNEKVWFYLLLTILIINVGNSSIYKFFNPKRYKNIKYYQYVKVINKELKNIKGEVLIQNSIIPVLKKNNDFKMLSAQNINKKNSIILINPKLNPWPLTEEKLKKIIEKRHVIFHVSNFYLIK